MNASSIADLVAVSDYERLGMDLLEAVRRGNKERCIQLLSQNVNTDLRDAVRKH